MHAGGAALAFPSMHTPWILRDGTPAAAADYAAFAREIFVATYAGTYDASRLARHVEDRFGEARQRADLTDAARTTLVALDAVGAWAGFAVLRRHAAPPEVRARDPVELERFYVGTAWHGRGLAQALMDAALARAARQGHDAVWLSVWRHNGRARRFYEKSGFTAIGEVTFVFGGEAERDTLMVRAAPVAP